MSNTDAQNQTRFEGAGVHGGSIVQGRIATPRISVVDLGTDDVSPRHLNPHIDYSQLKSNAAIKQHSIATPLQMALDRTGTELNVAALGSSRIARYATADLESDSAWANFDSIAASEQYLDVAGGPVGLWLDESLQQVYVLTHFDNALVVMDLTSRAEKQRLPMFNPEPAVQTAGRPMLYDAQRSSSNGEASCASCHIFGDLDQLAWNLGNPDAGNTRNPPPQPTRNLTELSCTATGPNDPFCTFLDIVNGDGNLDRFASMKGPMTTQTLRGMSTHGHMHWRGDRSNGYFWVDEAQTLDERLSLKNFIVTFEGLLGLDVELPLSVNASAKAADVVAF